MGATLRVLQEELSDRPPVEEKEVLPEESTAGGYGAEGLPMGQHAVGLLLLIVV